MLERLRTARYDNLRLTIPDLINWTVVAGFTHRESRRATVYPDVHFQNLRHEIGALDTVEIDFLKRRKIHAVADDETTIIESWPVFRCIYFEVELEGNTYILTNGRWYSVGNEFLRSVNDFFNTMRQADLVLPDCTERAEKDYCLRASANEPLALALMDRNLVRRPGLYGMIEFCDLYSVRKHIVHIKRYAGSSAPLSHLFNQAVVSATLFKRSSDFRSEVNQKLPEQFRPVSTAPSLGEYEVVFGVISKSRNPLRLPFFSRLT